MKTIILIILTISCIFFMLTCKDFISYFAVFYLFLFFYFFWALVYLTAWKIHGIISKGGLKVKKMNLKKLISKEFWEQ